MLAPAWGVVLIILGFLSLVINHRGMFIALGVSLVLIGLLNLAASLDGDPGFWTAFGGMQVYWGFKEMAKFRKYGREQIVETTFPVECPKGCISGNLDS